ncbi:homoserine dehydrogenase [bacterium]
MKRKVNIGLIGLGTVGSGVVKILNNKSLDISTKAGADVVIKRIVTKDTKKAKHIKYNPKIVSKNIDDILNDPDIDIVVELIGGYEPARTFILKAIKKGKHIVTANKAVLAKYWDEIHSQAFKSNKLVYFEAAVGGGIPIIQGLNEGLSANTIESMYGILNGTTNYILTQMSKEQMSFKDALKTAQRAGFAEADPTFDIKGVDSIHKLAILSAIAYGKLIDIKDIYCEGIDKIYLEDINFAGKEFNLTLKLLGIAKHDKNKTEVRVHPTLIPRDHLLASVDNEYNAIYVKGDSAGKTMFYGKGAGRLAAASAVVSDIIYTARHIITGTAGEMPLVTYSRRNKLNVSNIDDLESKYYIRFQADDKPGVLSTISGILGKYKVSIESCSQKWRSTKYVPIIMLTHKAKEKNVKTALNQINKLKAIKAPSIFIRIEDEL